MVQNVDPNIVFIALFILYCSLFKRIIKLLNTADFMVY